MEVLVMMRVAQQGILIVEARKLRSLTSFNLKAIFEKLPGGPNQRKGFGIKGVKRLQIL